jgi:hypothetical protein
MTGEVTDIISEEFEVIGQADRTIQNCMVDIISEFDDKGCQTDPIFIAEKPLEIELKLTHSEEVKINLTINVNSTIPVGEQRPSSKGMEQKFADLKKDQLISSLQKENTQLEKKLQLTRQSLTKTQVSIVEMNLNPDINYWINKHDEVMGKLTQVSKQLHDLPKCPCYKSSIIIGCQDDEDSD